MGFQLGWRDYWEMDQRLCYTLGELFKVCPCPEILQKTEFQCSRIIDVIEKVSRQPNIQAVVCVMIAGFFESRFSVRIMSKK